MHDNNHAEYFPTQEESPIEPPSAGWFRAMRGDTAMELIRANPLAYVLAAVIAHRGQYKAGFNRFNLGPGEALLGDYEEYGMSEQNYRTAKAQLEKWGFATFKATSKGTVGKLADTRLFAIFKLEGNGQANRQPTDSQRTGNGRVTTTKNIRTKEREEHKEGEPSDLELTTGESIRLEHELERIEAKLKSIEGGASHDAWGPMYDDHEKIQRSTLKERRDKIKERLGWIA